MSKSDRMRLIELQRGQSMKAILQDLAQEGKTPEEMALVLDVSSMTVRRWLRGLGAVPVHRFHFPEEPAGVG